MHIFLRGVKFNNLYYPIIVLLTPGDNNAYRPRLFSDVFVFTLLLVLYWPIVSAAFEQFKTKSA